MQCMPFFVFWEMCKLLKQKIRTKSLKQTESIIYHTLICIYANVKPESFCHFFPNHEEEVCPYFYKKQHENGSEWVSVLFHFRKS